MMPIPNVRDELDAIASLLQTRSIALERRLLIESEIDADRVPELVRENFARASIVHLAGHGIFDSVDPMASAMFLGGANHKGLVRAADLAGVDLSKTEILALSGCETGLAVLKPGQEALGFVRGALVAGARRMLLTQWTVDDAATALWFAEFYRHLTNGSSPEQAFRETVLGMSVRYRHPYYWAGITLYAR
jgi:CHAT domain-containing protein